MPRVQFSDHLQRFFPDLVEEEVAGATVAEVVLALEERRPGLSAYLVDERGALRPHVNIFVGNRGVRDRRGLSDAVTADAKLYVLQALSGG
jgi:hypothetical protein